MTNHKEASLSPLLLAEAIPSTLFIERESVLAQGGKRNEPSVQYERGWNTIEQGLSLGEVACAAAGVTILREVLLKPKVAENHRPPYARTLATLAFEQALYDRITTPGPLNADIMDHTYREYAKVIEAVCEADGINKYELRENLSEMIVVGGLARLKQGNSFPFVASPREEHNGDYSIENHDSYLLQWSPNKTPRKKAIQVATQDRGEGLTRDNVDPSVTNLYVLPTITGILEDYPTINKRLRGAHTSLQDTKDGFLRYIAELITSDALARQISSTEKKILNRLSQEFARKMNNKARNQKNVQKAASPLTHSLGDQLRGLLDNGLE